MIPAKTPQDQYIKVDQIKTRFWTLGEKGTTIILLHGIGSSVESWMFNISALAQYHRVYAVDLPGFGLSEKSQGQFSLLSYAAQFINDFMQIQGIRKANIIGNSMGGGIALQFAIQFPAKVERLVIVNSVGLGKELALELRLATVPLIGEFFIGTGRKATVRYLLEKCVYDPAVITDNLVEISYQYILQPGAQKHFLSTLRGISNFRGQHAYYVNSIVDNLKIITAKTLIIWGKQDHIIPVAHANIIKERLSSAELHILDPCGHNPQLEFPEAFNTLVLEYLAR